MGDFVINKNMLSLHYFNIDALLIIINNEVSQTYFLTGSTIFICRKNRLRFFFYLVLDFVNVNKLKGDVSYF